MKKKTSSEAFFAETYGPVLRKIGERSIPDARAIELEKKRAADRNRQRLKRAGTQLSPEARRAIRAETARRMSAAKTPEQHALHASLAKSYQSKKLRPETRRKLAVAQRVVIMRRSAEERLEMTMRALDLRWGIKSDWPFPRPRIPREVRMELELRIRDYSKHDN